ncbi:hypothetical protein BJ684DRAFT_14799 [Piptocephalis cylindrospora]|uniref:GATA-type domain-containing protein n=1 Tax=Piptocephalis cylindrospora TaxID=1907219 RepID=A0A4P9Y7Z9_9FUNG|nr:hypothetical protein BJ684DRAFT_14799 [Piptocephalis cylindrospora]|eukprot:RKP14912.1 hypothetical protein BJ684DRAFT_14799 [Piptocephalis cylindrospora]
MSLHSASQLLEALRSSRNSQLDDLFLPLPEGAQIQPEALQVATVVIGPSAYPQTKISLYQASAAMDDSTPGSGICIEFVERPGKPLLCPETTVASRVAGRVQGFGDEVVLSILPTVKASHAYLARMTWRIQPTQVHILNVQDPLWRAIQRCTRSGLEGYDQLDHIWRERKEKLESYGTLPAHQICRAMKHCGSTVPLESLILARKVKTTLLERSGDSGRKAPRKRAGVKRQKPTPTEISTPTTSGHLGSSKAEATSSLAVATTPSSGPLTGTENSNHPTDTPTPTPIPAQPPVPTPTPTFSSASPAPPSAGIPGQKCEHCGRTETPMWRKGPHGADTLCNACGVKWRQGKILKNLNPVDAPASGTRVDGSSLGEGATKSVEEDDQALAKRAKLNHNEAMEEDKSPSSSTQAVKEDIPRENHPPSSPSRLSTSRVTPMEDVVTERGSETSIPAQKDDEVVEALENGSSSSSSSSSNPLKSSSEPAGNFSFEKDSIEPSSLPPSSTQ